MKDNSREVFITVDRIPLVVTITDDGIGGSDIVSVNVLGSPHNIYDLIGDQEKGIIQYEIYEALREGTLQQEMDIAEDKALWRDVR